MYTACLTANKKTKKIHIFGHTEKIAILSQHKKKNAKKKSLKSSAVRVQQ